MDAKPTPERALARIARRQHGVVTRHEALEAGLTARQIEVRLGKGWLIRVHRAVYRVGHAAPSDEARYLAAVKACGDGAALSGLSGAHNLRLLRTPTAGVEVTAPRFHRVPGVLVHRARGAPIETREVNGIPTTSPARTLVDVASRLDDERLGGACHEAWVRYRTGAPEIEDALARRPKTPGARRLLAIVRGDEPTVLSRMERRFIALLRADGRELPETNVLVDAHVVDCRWPGLRLTVELDSYRFHGSRRAWERDRRREREARARGDDLIRFTRDDVFVHYEAMLAELGRRVPHRRSRSRRRQQSRPAPP